MCMYNTDKILWLHLYLFRSIMVSRGGEKTGELMCFVTELFRNLTDLAISVLFSFRFSVYSLWETQEKPLQALMGKEQWV